ncbi:protein THYLAKOID ASSEMBLY 8, chloroplastic [Corylus avellana]|uniref:protein THYLAKOID ASSEMBLY 8, chloroplastic n=1 Tax=Corylus avellana TaxID=13451 RepID=UPI001E224DCF|nr:protein THYLAKOID ASSEMBLY 8, chloroplastic [Corylus avellana]
MASTLHQSLTSLKPHRPPNPNPTTTTLRSTSYVPIRCGPRSNRGPLMKGRILSIEAINAIQAVKRAQKSSDDPTQLPALLSKTLNRLIKSDLLATLRELLRQDQCALALHAFSAFRSEYQPDLSLYADVASALARNGMVEDMDRLIRDLEEGDSGGGIIQCDDKGLIRLVKAVIGAGRRESTVRIYRMMKRSGWGSSIEADEYVVRVLSKGLRSVGEEGLGDEVKRVNLEKLRVNL